MNANSSDNADQLLNRNNSNNIDQRPKEEAQSSGSDDELVVIGGNSNKQKVTQKLRFRSGEEPTSNKQSENSNIPSPLNTNVSGNLQPSILNSNSMNRNNNLNQGDQRSVQALGENLSAAGMTQVPIDQLSTPSAAVTTPQTSKKRRKIPKNRDL